MGRNSTGQIGATSPGLLPGSRNRRKMQVLLIVGEVGQVNDNISVYRQRVGHGRCGVRRFIREVQRGYVEWMVSSLTFSRTAHEETPARPIRNDGSP